MDLSKVVIPEYHKLNTESIVSIENNEPLICLSDCNNPRILFEPMYFLNGVPGAISKCYMRKSIYDKLCRAISLLPEGYCFKVFDAWRPFEVQQSLYNEYVDKLIKTEGVEVEIAKEKATCFVSKPSKDICHPAVHSTGGAIDLTIVDNNHDELNMGTEFDDFSVLANTDAFENSDNEEVRENRRLLYHIMTSTGFTNFPSEWWHYDYGDTFWAAQNGVSFALYGGIYEI